MGAELHRKIDLQSPADLAYLQVNIIAAAQQKLDLHIPPSATPQEETDPFRLKVEQLVHEYVAQTLALALPNLSINGLDASPTLLVSKQNITGQASNDNDAPVDPNDPAYESYDARLASKVRDMYATLESETTRVAELRREAPARAAAQYLEKLRVELDQDESALARLRESTSGQPTGSIQAALQVKRADEVRKTLQDSRQDLENLRRVTETVATLERAQRAVIEVERG